MQPRLHNPVDVQVRPLNKAGTTIDPVFQVPVDGAGNPGPPSYGEPLTITAQVSFQAHKAHRYKPEGDDQVTAGTMTILTSDMPPGIDLKDARVDTIAGEPVALLIKELRPGGWSAGGKAALYRAKLEDADHADG